MKVELVANTDNLMLAHVKFIRWIVVLLIELGKTDGVGDWRYPIQSRRGAGILPHYLNQTGAAGAGSDTARDRRRAT
jgi:hypothetical protein